MSHPASGWAEQDPADWERGIARTVRELRERAGVEPGEVEVLALASQVDGLVAVDEHLRALRPAIIWLDRRATAQSARLSDAVGEDELIVRTGLESRRVPHARPRRCGCATRNPSTTARRAGSHRSEVI